MIKKLTFFLQDKINVIEILNESSYGKQIVQNFIDNYESYLTHEDRKKIVSIVCLHLVVVDIGLNGNVIKILITDRLDENTSSSVTHTPKIYSYMEQTFNFRERQQSTKKFKCATDVIRKFHRYIDVDEGALVIAFTLFFV